MENLSHKKQELIAEKPKQLVSKNNGIRLEDNRQHSTIQKKANNTGLPNQLKSGIENLSGHSMDDVKVHYNSSKPAQLNAHAYAQGTDIHVASGQEKHLPHEAWHVVQQKQGRVKPTMQLKAKVNINDDKSLEKEADVMGAKAISFVQRVQKDQTPTITQRKSFVPDNESTQFAPKTFEVTQLVKKKKKKKEEVQSLADRSYNNLCHYRPGWVRKNGITSEHVRAFIKTYKSGIRGHHSGTSQDKEQQNTTNDCLAFKSWFTTNYGWS